MQHVWSFLPNTAQVLAIFENVLLFHHNILQAVMKLNEKGMVGLRPPVALLYKVQIWYCLLKHTTVVWKWETLPEIFTKPFYS